VRPLSSIDQQSGEIGERAAKLALELIESKTPQKANSVLPAPPLTVRESSARTELR
jgi:DNA-binding LacI/PurR family transcriptional regulator